MIGATIMAGLVAGVFEWISSEKESEALGEAGEKSEAMYLLSNENVLKELELTEMLGMEKIGLGKKGLALSASEAAKGRAERAEERKYQRKQDVVNRGLQMLNIQSGLKNQVLGTWDKIGYSFGGGV